MRKPGPRARDERGASSIELVIYMPVLLIITLLAVQFALYHLGRQTAGTVARETARVARVTSDEGEARRAGERYVSQLGQGVLEDHRIDIDIDDGSGRVRVTVSGKSMRILPAGVPRITQAVEGPLEQFVERQ